MPPLASILSEDRKVDIQLEPGFFAVLQHTALQQMGISDLAAGNYLLSNSYECASILIGPASGAKHLGEPEFTPSQEGVIYVYQLPKYLTFPFGMPTRCEQ